MLKRAGYWKLWLVLGFVTVIAFTWLNEIIDLPHLILGAPSTPVNWRESLIETVFSLMMGTICWKWIEDYESRWVQTTQQLQKLAITDELSGLLNRRELLARVEKEFERAHRFGRPLSIGILDLDRFKQVNDKYGHPVGDQVIRELSTEINLHLRAQDITGRIGGDEFMIAFIESSRSDAREISRRIQQGWQKVELHDEKERSVEMTFSMGITSVMKKDRSLLDCIQRADKALYEAKHKGRNKIVLA